MGGKLRTTQQFEEDAQRSVENWSRQVDRAQESLEKLSGQAADGESLGKITAGAQKGGDALERLGKHAQKAIEQLASALKEAGVAQAADAVTEALGQCVESAQGFEAGMAQVFTLLPGQSSSAYQALSDGALAFSTSMGVLSEEAVPALYAALSAGIPQETVFSFLESAQKAAVGLQ